MLTPRARCSRPLSHQSTHLWLGSQRLFLTIVAVLQMGLSVRKRKMLVRKLYLSVSSARLVRKLRMLAPNPYPSALLAVLVQEHKTLAQKQSLLASSVVMVHVLKPQPLKRYPLASQPGQGLEPKTRVLELALQASHAALVHEANSLAPRPCPSVS